LSVCAPPNDESLQVLDPCLAFFVALVARDKRDVDDLTRKDDFFDAMALLLATERDRDGLLLLDNADGRKPGLAKTARVAVSAVSVILLGYALTNPFTAFKST